MKSPSGLPLLVALAALVAWPRIAHGHEMRTAEVVVEARSPTTAAVIVSAPRTSTLILEAPAGCTLEAGSRPASVLRCANGMGGATVAVRGLGRDVDLAWVRMVGFDGRDGIESTMVTAHASTFTIPGAAARGDVAVRYVRFGAEHVLSGLDHVLFMIALFWQAWAVGRSSFRRTGLELARTATAFTLAHSMTLIASVLGIIRIAPALSEACIASTLFLAALDIGRDREVVRGAVGGRGVTRAALAAAFGLVHGLGFAGALAETRLPEGARWTAIVAFNFGVELGQLFVFAACLGAIALAGAFTRPASGGSAGVFTRPASGGSAGVFTRPASGGSACGAAAGARLVERLALVSSYGVGVSGATLFFLRVVSLVHG